MDLIEILSNTVIVRQLAPYLPVSSLFALSRVNRSTKDLVFNQPELWRSLTLSKVKSAITDSVSIDVGGVSWRAERMDESLTEDEFYSGPLRGIFSHLQSANLLQYIHILVLDGLSVPADLVREIMCEERFNVRILSIRDCKNLNQTILQQVIRYAVRPTRAEGTPKVKAIYFFGHTDVEPPAFVHDPVDQKQPGGVMSSTGAAIGAHWNTLSTAVFSSFTAQDGQAKWYGRSGRVLRRPQSDWPDTINACRGIIAFDAVLCRGPRHDITKVSSTDYLQPAVATVALGPGGCEACGSIPEGSAVFGESDSSALPILSPPPVQSATVRAAQRPETITGKMPLLHLRCEDCLRGRWCERCNRFWCEECYTEPVSRVNGTTDIDTASSADTLREHGWDVQGKGAPVKMGVHRDCFDCGRTCSHCHDELIRICRWCNTGYCKIDDEDSTEKMCSWCSHSGRRTAELY